MCLSQTLGIEVVGYDVFGMLTNFWDVLIHQKTAFVAALKEFEINAIGWEILYFFMFLVVVEHLVIVFRLIIRNSSEVKPAFVKQGERERSDLLKKFSQKKNRKEERKTERILKKNASKCLNRNGYE